MSSQPADRPEWPLPNPRARKGKRDTFFWRIRESSTCEAGKVLGGLQEGNVSEAEGSVPTKGRQAQLVQDLGDRTVVWKGRLTRDLEVWGVRPSPGQVFAGPGL